MKLSFYMILLIEYEIDFFARNPTLLPLDEQYIAFTPDVYMNTFFEERSGFAMNVYIYELRLFILISKLVSLQALQ